ncbi:MAG: hypothetical protein ACFFDN_00830 [Candidatus Hodarchaeota archaeon]
MIDIDILNKEIFNALVCESDDQYCGAWATEIDEDSDFYKWLKEEGYKLFYNYLKNQGKDFNAIKEQLLWEAQKECAAFKEPSDKNSAAWLAWSINRDFREYLLELPYLDDLPKEEGKGGRINIKAPRGDEN